MHKTSGKFKLPLEQTYYYPSSRRSKRASSERFLSLNHFLRLGDKILHCLVVFTSLLSMTKGMTLLLEPAFTTALTPDFLSVM